ncbi:MAG: hypothetical protein ABIP30_17110 [Ferruginibacter sp.]
MYTAVTENPKELPAELPVLPDAIPDINVITPAEVVEPITDIEPDTYNEAINNLVAKYTKK